MKSAPTAVAAVLAETAESAAQTAAAPDIFVPDQVVREEFGDISEITQWRWDNDPELGFPPPIYIRGRKFRSRRMLEAFKQKVLTDAIEGRARRPRRRGVALGDHQ
jgi:hypothetical protein